MEVVNNSFLPGDPRLIDHIVYELKSQGIFDNFRKECIADVDTKPAYQNLRQRVEGSVSGFLKTQKWRSDMNKNHVREMLRKNISESGFLETGVERIVDQVVNPKINTIFLPQVENVVYKVLGIQNPTAFDDLKKEDQVDEVKLDLLPNDLEAVSPESEPQEKKLDISIDAPKVEDKIEEDESPAFEPLEQIIHHEENSVDSNLSGISGLVSHDSNHSIENMNKHLPLEISNPDSQLSKQSSDDRLSIVMSDEQDTKMETNDDSNTSKVSSVKVVDTNSKSVDVPDSQSSTEIPEITSTSEKTEEVKKIEEKRSSEKKSDKHHSSHKHSSHKSKYDSKDRKSDKDKKSDRDKKDHRNHKSSESSERKDKDKKPKSEKDEKHSDSKGTKESKSEKSRERTSSGHRHSKDKSSKRESHEHKSKESEHKESKTRTSSESKDSKSKESKERSKDESKSRSHSSSKKPKDESKGHSKHNGKSKTDSSESSKISSKDSKRGDKYHKKDEKHSSHSSERKNDKRDKDKRDSRKESKKDSKDDHYSLKEKKSHRRSTDRDSSDGHSGTHSSSSSFADLNTCQLQKSSQETSMVDSGATSGGDSGNSDAIIGLLSQTTDISSIPCIVSEEENARVLSNKIPHLKLIKPKFASNIFEARKLMKIRKKLGKLEKQRQMELMGTNNSLNELLSVSESNSNNHKLSDQIALNTNDTQLKSKKSNANSTTSKARKEKDGKKKSQRTSDENEVEVVQPPNDEEPLQTSVISKESWDAIEAKLNAQNIIDYNSYTDSSQNIKLLQDIKKSEQKIINESKGVNECKAEEVEQKNETNFKGFPDGSIRYAEKCLKLSHQVITDLEADLEKLCKACSVTLSEKGKSRFQKDNEEFSELNRLPKIEIVDVTSNNEIIFSPGRGIKRIANDHTDVHNNNKINKELDLLNDRLDDITDHEQSAMPTHKSKKPKLTDTSVNPLENFNLPLSPADSDKSYNSINDKKNDVPEGRPRRNRAISNQRYSSDDLYKPRLQFSSTRRRTTNTEKN